MTVIYILNATIMGGATISFMNMLEGLMPKGVTPIVVIPKGNISKEFAQFLKKNDISFFQAHITMSALHKPRIFRDYIKLPLSFLKMNLYRLITESELRKIIRTTHPDIIHTNVGVIHEGGKIARSLHIPHIFHLREYQDIDFNWMIYPSKSSFEKQLGKSSAVISITDGIRSHFNLTDVPTAHTIYNGIFHETESIYIHDKSKYFLCMSRISPEKGHPDVIAAFSEFHKRHPDYRLVIAGFGDNKYIEGLKALAGNTGCLEAIDFVGFHHDVKPLMSRAKALIVASHNEGFGRMTAEACFMGCIVIGRNTAGTKEIMGKTGGLGFMDTKMLLSRMEEIYNMPDEQYKALALTAQQKATQLFSIEQHIEKIYSLYNNIISEQ